MSTLLSQKLDNCLAEKNCYEAHQIYRTMYFRLVRANKFEDAYDRMYEGSMNMFNMSEPLSGVDLSNLLLDLLNLENAGKILLDKKGDLVYKNVASLFNRILPDTQDRDAFVVKALSTPCLISGRDILRTKFANIYWKESNYFQARKHFLHSSESGDKVANFLIEFQLSQTIPEEVDLLIVQFVLQCLVIKKFELACSTFFNYVEKHPHIGRNKPNFATPLLNFIYYLIEALNGQKNDAELPKVFMALCNLYQSSLDRDPDFHKYLETIGHNYFGLPKPQKSEDDNPLATLMKSFLGDQGPSGSGSESSSGATNPLMQMLRQPSGQGSMNPIMQIFNTQAAGQGSMRTGQSASNVRSQTTTTQQQPTDDDLD